MSHLVLATMPKRKRDEGQLQEQVDPTDHHPVRRSRHSCIEQVLDLGKKNVFKSLKLARGFERQKLGRRQKVAKEDNAAEEIARLEAEVVVLKVRCTSKEARRVPLLMSVVDFRFGSYSGDTFVQVHTKIQIDIFFPRSSRLHYDQGPITFAATRNLSCKCTSPTIQLQRRKDGSGRDY